MHKMHKIGHHKTFISTIILAALLLALLVSFWGQPEFVAFVGRFFDVMLPVLAVGALLKYLLSYNSSHIKHGNKTICELCGVEIVAEDGEEVSK